MSGNRSRTESVPVIAVFEDRAIPLSKSTVTAESPAPAGAPNGWTVHLGELAKRFRSTQDLAERRSIAVEYATTVRLLIGSRTWKEKPPVEDQLPAEYMPLAFLAFWTTGRD